ADEDIHRAIAVACWGVNFPGDVNKLAPVILRVVRAAGYEPATLPEGDRLVPRYSSVAEPPAPPKRTLEALGPVTCWRDALVTLANKHDRLVESLHEYL